MQHATVSPGMLQRRRSHWGELILLNLLEICRFSGMFLILCYDNYLFIIKLGAFVKVEKMGF